MHTTAALSFKCTIHNFQDTTGRPFGDYIQLTPDTLNSMATGWPISNKYCLTLTVPVTTIDALRHFETG